MVYIYTADAPVFDGAGHITLRADYDPQLHRAALVISDGDLVFDGDISDRHIGNDANQTGALHDLQGALIVSGPVYSDGYSLLRAPDGILIRADLVKFGGGAQDDILYGYAMSTPLEAGVTYTMIESGDTGKVAKVDVDNRTTDDIFTSVPCIAAGTSVMTSEGMVPVDWLRPGDRLLTRDRGFQPLLWVGRLDPDEAGGGTGRAILIAAGALGAEMPTAPLRVSPHHRVLVSDTQLQLCFGHDAMFCAADFLTHLPGIAAETEGPAPVYYRLLLPRHEAILAEGTWAESLFLGDLVQEVIAPDTLAALSERLDLTQGAHRHTAYPCLKRWEAALIRPPVGATPAEDDGEAQGPLRARA
ncbi:Hint domain-containing protein [Acidimangrovimonas sediminis]|uniref:Hint domain-containing protein n=1 Tax=Acidimangrovimonas sediminis TaxID=2056283 RepID=UPI001304EC15|nr:Hint domain-containing protein [Acidimangrovimonas sediminis]